MLLAVLLIYTGYSVFFCYSTLAPFFPAELESRHFSRLYNIAVFGVFALSFVVGSLLSKSHLIPVCGRARTFALAALF